MKESARVDVAKQAPLACECCHVAQSPVAQGDGFRCQCAEDLWCQRCGHCTKHCSCAALPDLDVPWTEKLAVAKHECRRLGVRV